MRRRNARAKSDTEIDRTLAATANRVWELRAQGNNSKPNFVWSVAGLRLKGFGFGVPPIGTEPKQPP